MKLLFIILSIAAVIIAAVFLFLTFSPKKQVTPTAQKKVITGTFYTIATKPEAQMCTWEDTKSTATTKGTVYTAGKNFRATTQTVSGDMAINNYYLGDGEKVYIWSDLTETGSSIDYAAFKDPSRKGTIFDAESSYNCVSWKKDPTLFEVPSSITFQ